MTHTKYFTNEYWTLLSGRVLPHPYAENTVGSQSNVGHFFREGSHSIPLKRVQSAYCKSPDSAVLDVLLGFIAHQPATTK